MTEEKRIVTDERRYAIISKESVKLMADAGGHEDTCDSVAGILGEDASYRLREITQKSAQFMRHARRKRMNTDDFNKACRFSDVPPVLGHGSTEPAESFQSVKAEQGEAIHFVPDPHVDLAGEVASACVPKFSGETTIKAHWLVVEGVQKSVQNPQGTPGNKVEAGSSLLKYFEKITQAVLGNDAEMMKMALTDLRTNCNISPLMPHFVSFINNGVKTNGGQVMRILYMAQSLLSNTSLFLDVQPYLSLVIESVHSWLLEPVSPTTDHDDHWLVRDYAARVLAHIVRVWGSSVNQLCRHTERALGDILHDLSRPFPAHYGATMGLLYLGTQSVERVLVPHLPIYMPHLQETMEFQGRNFLQLQTEATRVHGAILLCVEHVLQKSIRDFKEKVVNSSTSKPESQQLLDDITDFKSRMTNQPSSTGFASPSHKSPCAFYSEMIEYFGDALSIKLPEIQELKTHVFLPQERDLVTVITDPTAAKSGEELLDELVNEVKREEMLKKKQVKQESQCLTPQRTHDRTRRMADNRQQLRELATYHQLQKIKREPDTLADVDVVNVDSDVDLGNTSIAGGSQSGSGSGPSGQGFKLTFMKSAKLESDYAFSVDSASDFTDLRSKDDDRSGRKRKQSPDLDFLQLQASGSDFSHPKHRKMDQ